jgi:hypothetical protein
MGIFGYLDGDACMFSSAVAAVTYPAPTMRLVRKVPVFRYLYGNTLIINFSVTTLTSPPVAIAGVKQVGVLRYPDGNALLSYGPITTVTRPAGAKGFNYRVTIFRYLNSATRAFGLSITTLAFPSMAIILQVGMFGYLDSYAVFVNLPEASLTFPSTASRGVCYIGVGGCLNRHAGILVSSTIAFVTLPAFDMPGCVGVCRYRVINLRGRWKRQTGKQRQYGATK